MVRAALAVLALAPLALGGAAGCGRDHATLGCVDAAVTAVRRSRPTLGALAAAPHALGELGRVVATACARDGWSRAAIGCVHGAAVEPALRACRARLSDPQRAALERDVRAFLDMAR